VSRYAHLAADDLASFAERLCALHAVRCAVAELTRTRPCLGRVLTVSEGRLALPNFYNITIRIADVAACLAILVLWLRDELGSSISP
jgi:hypothetical protein